MIALEVHLFLVKRVNVKYAGFELVTVHSLSSLVHLINIIITVFILNKGSTVSVRTPEL